MTLTPEALADLRVLSFDDAPETAFSVASSDALKTAGCARLKWAYTPNLKGMRLHLTITDTGRAALKREHDREQSK